MRLLILFLLCVCAATACESPKENRIEKMASTYCDCLTELAQLNDKIRSAGSDTLAQQQMSAYLTQVQVEYNKAKECTATVVGQYGKLNSAALDSVRLITQKKCPSVGNQRDLLREMLGE